MPAIFHHYAYALPGSSRANDNWACSSVKKLQKKEEEKNRNVLSEWRRELKIRINLVLMIYRCPVIYPIGVRAVEVFFRPYKSVSIVL